MAWNWIIARGVTLLGLLVAGCGSSAGPSTPAYVGRVTDQGQDAVVGAVTDGVDVSFYLCGGPSTFATETHWLLGQAGEGGALDLTGDGWRVTGNLVSGAGQVESDQGQTLSWAVRPGRAGEGVYQAMVEGCRTGAVAADFDDDQGPRLQGTWCDAASHFEQVTPIKDPLSADGEHLDVQVEGPAPFGLVLARLVAPLPLP